MFHCALSQVRGPAAAARYVAEKGRREGEVQGEGKEDGEVGKGGEDEEGIEGKEGIEVGKGKGKQVVYVLQGGFTQWQEKYGQDERLTEGWQKDIWEFGY